MTKPIEEGVARALRAEHGTPVKELARLLEVSAGTISVWVRDIEIGGKQARRNFSRTARAEAWSAAQPRAPTRLPGRGTRSGSSRAAPAHGRVHALLGGGKQGPQLARTDELRRGNAPILRSLSAGVPCGLQRGHDGSPQRLLGKRAFPLSGRGLLARAAGSGTGLPSQARHQPFSDLHQWPEEDLAVRRLHGQGQAQHSSGAAHLRRDPGVRRFPTSLGGSTASTEWAAAARAAPSARAGGSPPGPRRPNARRRGRPP